MDALSITIAVCNLICGLFFVGLGLPLTQGRIARNSLYGFRFAKSYASEENWRLINRFGGLRMIWWAPLVFLAAIVPLFVRLENQPVLALALVLAPCLILVPCVQTYRFAQTLPDR